MGGDSCSKGGWFESQWLYWIDIFTFFVVEMVCLFKKTKINEKEAGEGQFKKEISSMK